MPAAAPTTQPGYGQHRTSCRSGWVQPLRHRQITSPLRTSSRVREGPDPTKRGLRDHPGPAHIPQAAYNSATTQLPSTAAEQYCKSAMQRRLPNRSGLTRPTTLLLSYSSRHVAAGDEGMHDEMGGVYDTLFGRMSGCSTLEPDPPRPCADTLRPREPAHRYPSRVGGDDSCRGDARRDADLGGSSTTAWIPPIHTTCSTPNSSTRWPRTGRS